MSVKDDLRALREKKHTTEREGGVVTMHAAQKRATEIDAYLRQLKRDDADAYRDVTEMRRVRCIPVFTAEFAEASETVRILSADGKSLTTMPRTEFEKCYVPADALDELAAPPVEPADDGDVPNNT